MKNQIFFLLTILMAKSLFAFNEFPDPNPSVNNGFGTHVVALSTGNIVITSPRADIGGKNDCGAVYLFSGATGALISTLFGTTAGDNIGSYGVTALANGNYVIVSPDWDGAKANVGAVTWGNGTTGVAGPVSALNSLVGSTLNDNIGITGITALANGNYIVRSANWYGAAANVGAVTWGNGTIGITGVISAANSLVGSTAWDQVGVTGITELTNGNYIVRSISWDNGSNADAGAVSWGDGTSGISGTVSVSNSLVGSSKDDRIGLKSIALTNGNYVVASNYWDYNTTMTDAGAVTWGSGTIGISGVVSEDNSLVGSYQMDGAGGQFGAFALSNGNYVVASPGWNSRYISVVGAVTWGNGTTGTKGKISTSNSLVGSSTMDQVGYAIEVLTNGNYIVRSPLWDNGLTDVGAVTWGNGSSGITGSVSAANSLIGSIAYDRIGYHGVTALTNGNYVVVSGNWHNVSKADAGAVTWGNGSTGISGTVSVANSLVGLSVNDRVGVRGVKNGVIALPDGNYVVTSTGWDGAASDVGAVTWANGTTGLIGVVSIANSLVGSTAGDNVGMDDMTILTNGNYIIRSQNWNNGAVVKAGAVTWCNGTSRTIGIVSTSNSLVGSTTNDRVGNAGITVLSNGNYVVKSGNWVNGGVPNAGAVTWGSGTSGVSGLVSSANSLVGSTASDLVGYSVTVLTNGNYMVASPVWDIRGSTDIGAATWGNGAEGVKGVVSIANSIVGHVANSNLLTPVTDNVNAQFCVPFVPFGGTGKVYIDKYDVIWTGKASTDWNTSLNWSTLAVPTWFRNVIIPLVTNDPVVNNVPVTPAICSNLSIQEGALVTIATSKALTISGTLTNNAGSSGLVINSGGSLLNNTPGVAATVESAIPANEWHLISPPISDAISNTFLGKYLQTHTESTNAYTDILPTTNPLTPMKGYALWGDAVGYTTAYTGTLNAGAKNYSTTYSGVDNGWNLVGNPYPSSIDWDAAGWTKTNVNAATYIHVNDATWASYVGSTGANGGSQYIAPGQGFFIQASGAGTLAMTDAVRVHKAASLIKSAEAVSKLLRVEVSGNGYKDESVVRFINEATTEFDGMYDAHKLFGDVPEAAQIYTLGNTELAINSQPEIINVPLGVRATGGIYTISSTQISNLTYVTLEDTRTGVFTDLITKPYTFSFTAGENENRFILHFTEMLSVDKVQSTMANIYSYQKTAYINLNDNLKGDVFVYNLTGQLVASRLSASGMNEIILPNTGAYIVKVICKESTVVRKVYIQ